MKNLLADSAPIAIILVVVVVLVLFMLLMLVLVRYKKCPSDKIMVIYGKISPNRDGTYRSAKCIHRSEEHTSELQSLA